MPQIKKVPILLFSKETYSKKLFSLVHTYIVHNSLFLIGNTAKPTCKPKTKQSDADIDELVRKSTDTKALETKRAGI